MNMLEVDTLGIDFGGLTAIDKLSFGVGRGQIFSIIGPNGAGKTTLFNIVSGLYRPSRGRVLLNGEDVTSQPPHRLAARGLSRTFQNLQIFFRMTTLENVMVGRHLKEARGLVPHLLRLPSAARQNAATETTARELLDFVGLARVAGQSAGNLSYGALKRLEIARALAAEPMLLMLDEPAAGCNSVETEEIDGLIQQVARRGVTVVLVEHDMKLVMKISDRILVLDQGRRLAEGSAEDVRRNPDVVRAYLGSQGQAATSPGGAAHG